MDFDREVNDMMRSLLACGAMALSVFLATAGPSSAQSTEAPLPRTITLHVGFAAGGPADTVARFIGEKLKARTGSNVIIMNRPGAGGTLAAAVVARLVPDGSNLLLVSSGHAGSKALYPNLPYDNQKDFDPIVALAQSPIVVLVGSQSPYKTLEDLVAAARAQPGKLTFGTGGGGATLTSLIALLMRQQLGYDAVAVPFRGSGPANIDLLAGHLDFGFDTVSGALGLLTSGKLRALAVSSKSRSSALPDVPTVDETVKPDFDYIGWFGLLGPAQMPSALIARLNAEVNAILSDPELVTRMRSIGLDPIGGTPDDFKALLASETVRWGSMIREFGVQPQ